MEVGRSVESPLVPRGIGRDTAGRAENLPAIMQVRGTKGYQNTGYYRPFEFETENVCVAVQNSMATPR